MKILKKINERIEVKLVSTDLDTVLRVLNQIRRHVDGVKEATYIEDSRYVCSFCNRQWEEEIDGEPMCCSMAQEEWRRS